jgi:hypothetical protein
MTTQTLVAEAQRVFQQAKAKGKPEAAYQWLRGWVKDHATHTSYPLPPNSFFGSDQGLRKMEGDKIPLCTGLEPYFEDAGYLAWILEQPVDKADAAELLSGVFMAAGYDRAQVTVKKAEPGAFGRLGRLLTLRSFGAALDADGRVVGSFHEGVVDLLAKYAPGVLPALIKLGLDLDKPEPDKYGYPPLFRLLRWGSVESVKALLDAGASLEVKNGQGQNALAFAKTWKVKSDKLKLLGAKKKTGSLDTRPLLALLEKRRATFAATPWGQAFEVRKSSLGGITTLCKELEASGANSWEACANSLDQLEPEEQFILALLLREVAPQQKKATPLTKITASRVILGDAISKGNVALSGGHHCLITGSLRCEVVSNDETASLFVAGKLAASLVVTEGNLWVGDDLSADSAVLAHFTEGALVVAGTLVTPVLIEEAHQVEAAKAKVKKRFTDATGAVLAKAFVPEVLRGSRVDGVALAKRVKAQKAFLRKT